MESVPFNTLQGKTILTVNVHRDKIEFTTKTGEEFVMLHDQDCCEEVIVESIQGDITKLIGCEVVDAVEHSNTTEPPVDPDDKLYGSYTWTYYTIRTINDTIVIRWYGSSNGYYSEEVTFHQVK